MKIAIVTGSSGGIGSVICQTLLDNEWFVIGLDKTKSGDIVNKNFIFKKCDLKDSNDIESTVNEIRKNYEKLSLLVNCAAVQKVNKAIDYTPHDWDETLQVNAKAPLMLSSLLQPLLFANSKKQSWSNIVNISSIHAKVTSEGMIAYAASKAALTSITRSLSIEFSKYNIRVNSITPGAVATPMLFEHLTKKQIDTLLNKQLIRELISPESIANLIIYLTSEHATNITGQDFIIDSGVLPQLLTEAK